MWVNVYPPFVESIGNAYATQELANKWAGPNRRACIKAAWSIGQGLNEEETQRLEAKNGHR